MIKIILRKSTLAIAVGTAIFSSQILFAGDVEVSLPNATSAFTVGQPAGNELMRVNGDGNVGIGTEIPSSKLHIKATATPSILFEDTSKMFSTRISGENFSIGNVVECGGANMYGNQIVVDGTGKTGINTNSPEAELHIKNKLGGTAACSQSATSFPASLILEGGKKWRFTSWDQPPVAFPDFTPDGQRLGILNQTNDEVMSFYSDGSIGIGKTDPREKLDVAGNIKASGTVCDSNGCIGDGASSKFVDGAAATDAVYTAGNVGIGTNSPNGKFHVLDTNNLYTYMQSTAGDSWSYALADNDSKSAALGAYAGPTYKGGTWMGYFGESYPAGSYDVFSGTPAGWGVIEARSASAGHNGLIISERADKPIVFGTNDTERVRIDNSGNVGIGTTAPTSKLQVVGLPIHADNTAAKGAGLTAGAFYHTGDGIVRVVY